MHEGDVNKLKTKVQILKLFQGVDLVLLTETLHFPSQHLSHIEGFDSLAVVHIVQLGKTKAIKHSGGVAAYFRSHLSPNLSQWREGSHDYYLWLQVNRGAAPNLFIYVMYAALVGSKHESKSLFQNLGVDIAEVQTLKGIVLLGGDFNARIAALPDTIDTNDLCELLQAPELAKIEQPRVVAMRQNRDANVSGWGCELLDLCCDAGLFILNGRTPSDK
jgi:endonuclease/exonuclease/phosphatase (EEP) superfamily protein YafD